MHTQLAAAGPMHYYNSAAPANLSQQRMGPLHHADMLGAMLAHTALSGGIYGGAAGGVATAAAIDGFSYPAMAYAPLLSPSGGQTLQVLLALLIKQKKT